MALKYISLAVLLLVNVQAQRYSVCIPSLRRPLCQTLDLGGSQAVCESVESSIECAIKLSRGSADIGVFSEEEMVLLGQHQPDSHRVVASIRDVSKNGIYAFEAVAVVPSTHTDGLEGLRGGRYCHPGLDEANLRWSPRVLKALERSAARTDQCPGADTNGKTAEELEVESLSQFFSSACRPGPWSASASVDSDLKSRYSSLCSLCGENSINSTCSSYTIDMGVNVAGVQNNNRHIQALQCLRSNNNNDNNKVVAFAAWQHVQEFFTIRNPQDITSYALLCEDGSTRQLTLEALNTAVAPCSLVRQPWGGIVVNKNKATEIFNVLQQWWPNGTNPGGNSWQANLFSGVVGGNNARISFMQPITAQNYTQVRNFTKVDASSSCFSPLRWCTTSNDELNKCSWLRSSAHVLGIEPAISCQQRSNIFDCFSNIRDNTADFIAASSNYGYLVRQHYKLSPVKYVQNSQSNTAAFSRIVALIKESSVNQINRFENLRNRKACFPEFGGIAYVAFVQAAHANGIIKPSECDYGKAVGEFFESACAPGALANSHALTESTYNATNLCSLCSPTVIINQETFTCAYDHTNMYFGNAGAMRCLADPSSDIAFVELQNIEAHLQQANLQPNQVRALCGNNVLANTTGVNIDRNCLLAYVVDAEVLSRRSDPLQNSLSTLLDTLSLYFTVNTAASNQLINFEMFESLDGVNNLLFKNTAVGLTDPTDSSTEAVRNYYELFNHLESCTSAAPLPATAHKQIMSIVTLFVMAFITKFILN